MWHRGQGIRRHGALIVVLYDRVFVCRPSAAVEQRGNSTSAGGLRLFAALVWQARSSAPGVLRAGRRLRARCPVGRTPQPGAVDRSLPPPQPPAARSSSITAPRANDCGEVWPWCWLCWRCDADVGALVRLPPSGSGAHGFPDAGSGVEHRSDSDGGRRNDVYLPLVAVIVLVAWARGDPRLAGTRASGRE